MQQKGGIDIIQLILEDCILSFPLSKFIISLYQQYVQRGWLTKGQLEGLYDKASKIQGMPPGRLATLESIIKRMPTRDRTPPPQNKPMFVKDEAAGLLIHQILEKYPNHKRVLFLRARYDDNTLTDTDKAELRRFQKLLLNESS